MNEKPPLGPGKSDHLASVLRGGAGAIPFVGGLIGEIIGQVIPGLRTKRIENYLAYLDTKIEDLSEEKKVALKQDEAAIEVFEEGAYQAARALSEERRHQIVELVAHGLRGEETERLEAKRLLSFLREIDDGQIIILASKLMKNYRDESFFDRHSDILNPPPYHLQADREDLDRHTVYQASRQKLVSLGLLTPNFKKPSKKDSLPDFDFKTGMVKSSGTDLTPLGRLLLSRLGLREDEEF